MVILTTGTHIKIDGTPSDPPFLSSALALCQNLFAISALSLLPPLRIFFPSVLANPAVRFIYPTKMKLIDAPSNPLARRLQRRGMAGYM
jgi:hypothetical protein